MNQTKVTRKQVVLSLVCLVLLLLSAVLAFGLSNGRHTAYADSSYSYGDPQVTNGVLHAITSLSDGQAYAAGWETDYSGPGLIEHLMNGSWRKADLPADTGPLHGISADSPTDIWAVGVNGDSPLTPTAQI